MKQSFVLILSGPLDVFCGTTIFLPFFRVVYLVLRYIRRRAVSLKIGCVIYGVMRRKKLRTWKTIMLVINVIYLFLGRVSFLG